MVELSSQVLRVRCINNLCERNDRGKCPGWPVTIATSLMIWMLACTAGVIEALHKEPTSFPGPFFNLPPVQRERSWEQD